MTAMPAGAVAVLVALVAALLMGFAIQRGGTCAVAAVDELLARRRATRLVALCEASIWVLAGVLLLRASGVAQLMPAGYEATAESLFGAALLGLGAVINGACVFGSVARLGGGQWVFALTPLGYFLGCRVLVGTPLADASSRVIDGPAPALLAPFWIVMVIGLAPCVRLLHWGWNALPGSRRDAWHGAGDGRRAGRGFEAMGRAAGAALMGAAADRTRDETPPARLTAASWNPHAATLAIGVSFLLLLVVAGPWAYTDVLAGLAHGMRLMSALPLALFACLFAGAWWGAWSAGAWRPRGAGFASASRCLVGGALMGVGASIVPGGNDGLLLLGMPMLWPHAWAAFATMMTVIALGLSLISLVRR